MDAEPRQHEAIHRTRSARAAREYGLVLRARGIPFVDVHTGGEHVLAVPAERAGEARAELGRYAEENLAWPPERTAPAFVSSGKTAAILWCVVIAVVFLLERDRAFSLPWHAAGRVDGARIAAGEWWRSITALTLHSDLAHLFGNALFGAVFVALACQLLGTGVSLLGILATGMLGNLVNVWVQGPDHLSVGASTAVFGAIGLQTSFLWAHRRRQRYSTVYVWAPIILGLAFLAFLGMPSWRPEEVLENLANAEAGLVRKTDYMAHATGLAVGLLLGAIAGRLAPGSLQRRDVQLTTGISCALALILAWVLAFAA